MHGFSLSNKTSHVEAVKEYDKLIRPSENKKKGALVTVRVSFWNI